MTVACCRHGHREQLQPLADFVLDSVNDCRRCRIRKSLVATFSPEAPILSWRPAPPIPRGSA
jgi:hypothetical protein